MCLAIYKPRGIHIAKRYLLNGFTNNDDGAGFAIATRDKRLEVHKGFATFETFWAEYHKHQAEQMIIHFRWATHGSRNEENCHPFSMCDGQIAMAHNGVLDVSIPDTEKHKSDTRVYCETILEPLLYRVPVDHPSLCELLGKAIGNGNKLIFLAADGKFSIVNAGQGYWHRGAWFSNSGYSYMQSWRGYGYTEYGCATRVSGERVYGNQQEYWRDLYGMRTGDYSRDGERYYKNGVEYYVGANTPTGKVKATAADDAWDDYKEHAREPLVLPPDVPKTNINMTDEELGILAADEECDCGAFKVMVVGDSTICAHCGIERPTANIIDVSDSTLADDVSMAESVALQQWEADQRKEVSFRDNGE